MALEETRAEAEKIVEKIYRTYTSYDTEDERIRYLMFRIACLEIETNTLGEGFNELARHAITSAEELE